MSEILQEIPNDKLENLRDLFKTNWPRALNAYYLVDNYIDWKKRNLLDMKFYCPDGKWDDGTFIAIDNRHFYYIYLFTLEKSCERLKNALQKSNLINWNEKEMLFCTVHEDNYSMVLNEIKNKGMSVEIDLTHDVSNMWWISKEDAIKYEYDIPPEVYLAALKEEDVDKIDSVWPHRSESSKIYLKELIDFNGGFGLYLKSDNTLCSWIMRNNYGGLAILQTDENHKRKNYASILTKHFSKYWAQKGLDIFCFIMRANKPSQVLFEKLGWKKEHGITWLHCENKNQ